MATVTISDTILNNIASNVFSSYQWLSVSTGTTPESNSSTSLTGQVQIGNTSALFNKLRDGTVPYTQLIAKKMVMQFTLATGEPFSQPVNIGKFALMSQITSGSGLGISLALPVTFSKDNSFQAKVRAEIGILRVSEV